MQARTTKAKRPVGMQLNKALLLLFSRQLGENRWYSFQGGRTKGQSSCCFQCLVIKSETRRQKMAALFSLLNLAELSGLRGCVQCPVRRNASYWHFTLLQHNTAISVTDSNHWLNKYIC